MLDNLIKERPAPQVLQALSIDMPQVSKAASEWYLACVQRGRKEPFAEVVTITPEIAEVLLAVNDSNRNHNVTRLNELRRDVERGGWELNGETIVVSRDGLLNDGQHRLLTVRESGISIRSFVVFGVERNTRLTVDTGTVRTAANFIAMDGGKDTNRAAAVALAMIYYAHGKVTLGTLALDKRPTKAELVSYYFQNRQQIDDAIHAVNIKAARELRSATALACGYMICGRINERAAATFFEKLCEGAGYDKSSAIHATRRRLIETTTMRLSGGEKLTLILGGWNAYRKGESPRTIQIRDKYPKVEK